MQNNGTVETALQRLFWNVTDFIVDSPYYPNAKNFEINFKTFKPEDVEKSWKPIYDSEHGLCYTFDPKTFQNGTVLTTFDFMRHNSIVSFGFDVKIS